MDSKRYNKKLFRLTWPIFIESFLRLMIGNVNVFMLSHYSDRAVGAVGIANQIISLVLVMYGIVSMGTAIIVSQYIGSGDKETAYKVANISLIINLLFGIILSLSMAIFGNFLLRTMNIPNDLSQYAYVYIVIVGGASFTQAIMAAMSAIARSFGYTKFPMYVAMAVNILNITGNYISLFRPFGIPVLGVNGVAASVVISEMIGVILSVYVYRKLKIKFRKSDFIPFPKEIVKDILKVGIPAAGESMSYNFSQMTTTYIVTMFGANAITAKVYGQNITYLTSTLGTSIGLGTQILVGQLTGAGKTKEVFKICLNSVKIAISINLILSLILFIFRSQIFGIFTHNQSIIDMGSMILTIDIVVELGRSINAVIGNSLRGTGDVRFPVLISITSMWGVSVTLCFLLGIYFSMGIVGVWIAFAVDECFRGILMLLRWFSLVWEEKALVRTKY